MARTDSSASFNANLAGTANIWPSAGPNASNPNELAAAIASAARRASYSAESMTLANRKSLSLSTSMRACVMVLTVGIEVGRNHNERETTREASHEVLGTALGTSGAGSCAT